MAHGVYVHIPWCRYRCPYCAFAIDTRSDPPHERYTDALLREHAEVAPRFEGRPTTLYFGGGTPSRARPQDIARLVAEIAPLGEVSLEANPEDADAFDAFRAAGITRLSLGVQSFQPDVARRLGRATGNALDAFRAARTAGFASVSFDLIFAVPGQTKESFLEDLRITAELSPEHVSLYGLTIEPGTRFATIGTTVDDDDWREMYDLACERLDAAGLRRYEVSNFARDGYRALHNEHYWRARSWAGLGAGAHGWWPDGTRTENVPEVGNYLRPNSRKGERPAPAALARELIWSTLRHVEGLERTVIRRWTGFEVAVPNALVENGLVREDGDTVRLLPSGFPLADGIAERIWLKSIGALRARSPRFRHTLPRT